MCVALKWITTAVYDCEISAAVARYLEAKERRTLLEPELCQNHEIMKQFRSNATNLEFYLIELMYNKKIPPAMILNYSNKLKTILVELKSSLRKGL